MDDMIRLVEPLIPALRRYARSLLRNREAADDLVQDCLERAVSRWHQRRADGDARTWVFTILHNLAINSLRQRTRRGWHVPVEDVNEAIFAHAPTQDDRLRHRDLLAGLAGLPEDQRAVLLLVAVEDLTYAEAARILDVPIGTVMSRLARGRDKLRQSLEGGGVAKIAPLRRVK